MGWLDNVRNKRGSTTHGRDNEQCDDYDRNARMNLSIVQTVPNRKRAGVQCRSPYGSQARQ